MHLSYGHVIIQDKEYQSKDKLQLLPLIGHRSLSREHNLDRMGTTKQRWSFRLVICFSLNRRSCYKNRYTRQSKTLPRLDYCIAYLERLPRFDSATHRSDENRDRYRVDREGNSSPGRLERVQLLPPVVPWEAGVGGSSWGV